MTNATLPNGIAGAWSIVFQILNLSCNVNLKLFILDGPKIQEEVRKRRIWGSSLARSATCCREWPTSKHNCTEI
jgi:hypothetical protein